MMDGGGIVVNCYVTVSMEHVILELENVSVTGDLKVFNVKSLVQMTTLVLGACKHAHNVA